eukprot:CAMPEP_0206059794 /NCGR_PEP_ID=MMETSP1466-20131121/49820_1 /ASSEMBLY_ACC=CAM_ASM_001126 /TAXON_ID=44452 /ORGANISM="Pavlova gyrans, Strain CCMP608" /LENGTH=38 /DNA_ID= /DNA_START= /DNA_END= /DNA_ORIENTATION=
MDPEPERFGILESTGTALCSAHMSSPASAQVQSAPSLG